MRRPRITTDLVSRISYLVGVGGIGDELRCTRYAVQPLLRLRLVSFGIALSLIVATTASAKPAPTPGHAIPDGYAKAKFGMSIAQVQKLYPKIQRVPANADGAPFLRSPDLVRLVLPSVKLRGLEGLVEVEMRFWKDTLWMVIVYYGANSFGAVAQQLFREYGEPATHGIDPTWKWPRQSLVTAPQQGWYSFADSELGREPQAAMLDALRALSGQPVAPPPAAPNAPVRP